MVDLARTFHDLVRYETALWNAVDARLQRSCGLTLARFETMNYLQHSGPCRVLDIAENLSISWGGASKIVDRVESAAHCRRSPNPDDARSSLITLTRLGQSLTTKAAVALQDELQHQLADAISRTQLQQLSQTLAQLHASSRTHE